jgi:CheY-like chemotaxis protein
MKRRILLADDSVTIQKVIELTFMDEDYEVRAVSNGDEAVALLSEMKPDFVIADVHMPGANGYEVCRRAKALRPELPVLLLVGTFEPFDEAQAAAVGADSFLKKPFDSQELLQRVDELLAAKAPTIAMPVTAASPAVTPAPAAHPAMAEPDWAAMPDLAAEAPAPRGVDFMGSAAVPELAAEPSWGSFELDPLSPGVGADAAPAAHPASPEPFDHEPSFSLEPDPGYQAEAEPVFSLEDEPAFGVREDVFGAPSELSLDSLDAPDSPAPAPRENHFLADEPAAPAAGFNWNAAVPEPAPEALHVETPSVPAWATPPAEPELRWSEKEAFVAVPADAPLPEPAAAAHEPAPAHEAAPAAAPAYAAQGGNGRLSDDDVDRIARRVAELLGDKAIRDVAWEVIPDLAEVIIRDRLRELEGQVE